MKVYVVRHGDKAEGDSAILKMLDFQMVKPVKKLSHGKKNYLMIYLNMGRMYCCSAMRAI